MGGTILYTFDNSSLRVSFEQELNMQQQSKGAYPDGN